MTHKVIALLYLMYLLYAGGRFPSTDIAEGGLHPFGLPLFGAAVGADVLTGPGPDQALWDDVTTLVGGGIVSPVGGRKGEAVREAGAELEAVDSERKNKGN